MRLAALMTLALAGAGCGYHVAGRGARLPKSIRTIAIPAFANVTTNYKLAERIPADLTREFVSRTRYRVVANPDEADAVLAGVLVSVVSYPTVFDPVSGRASGVQIIGTVSVTLTGPAGNVLFQRPNLEVRERYEIAVDPKAYFDESDVAIARMSRDMARTLVSAILENF